MEISCNKRINFSRDEEQLLVALVEKYKLVIENRKSNATTWKDKEKAWQVIEKEFNSNSGQNVRNSKQLKEKYLNMKKRTKQRFSNEKRYNKQTGGGPHTPVDITDVDIAIKDIIGKQITGLSNNYDCDSQMNSKYSHKKSLYIKFNFIVNI
ncbi:UPF0439 protein C9orf30 like protein [Cyphomyrmex costatus]|uniref:Regulatory protein zeste n=1 Tax=Cyphomyrmex costatus TaxID=456900 RepID=A0A151IJF3_9HYME|nr:UPF0439 protein C9orf30 like protein [Cyphomyrmex costatus]